MCVVSEVADKLESICDRHEMAMGTLLRWMLDHGLSSTSEALNCGGNHAAAATEGSA